MKVECEVATIHRIIDTTDLDQQQGGTSVAKNQVAEVTLRTKTPIAFDLSSSFESTGRFVLVDDYDIAGGGNRHRVRSMTNRSSCARKRASVILPGLRGESAAEDRAQTLRTPGRHRVVHRFDQTGKTFLARKVESLLVADGRHAYLLDGENLLHGLDADLSVQKAADAASRIRRYGEVARLPDR